MLTLFFNSCKNEPVSSHQDTVTKQVDSISKILLSQMTSRLDSFRGEIELINKTDIIGAKFDELSAGIVILLGTREDGELVFGTGCIIHSNGTALTNYHVVENMHEVNFAKVGEDSLHKASILAFDNQLDYAILQLNPSGIPYHHLKIASAMPRIGDECFTIGHPRGLAYTLTKGIVSAYRDSNTWIQIDAAINPGNSGGPLLNREGDLVGINTMKAVGEGLNFALSIREIEFESYISSFSKTATNQTPLASSRAIPGVQNIQFCAERALRAYCNAVIYSEFDFFSSLCAETLTRLESNKNVLRSEIGNVLAQFSANRGPAKIIDNEIEWDNASYSKHGSNIEGSVDVLLDITGALNVDISHIRIYIQLNSECQIIQAHSEVINSF